MSIRKSNGQVEYELTDADLALIEQFELIAGGASAEHAIEQRQLCVMQLVSILTHQQDLTPDFALTDNPPCVSEKITNFMIWLNDSDRVTSDDQRQELKELVPLVVGTCPVASSDRYGEVRVPTLEYARLERARGAILYSVSTYSSFEACVAAVKCAATITIDEADELLDNLPSYGAEEAR